MNKGKSKNKSYQNKKTEILSPENGKGNLEINKGKEDDYSKPIKGNFEKNLDILTCQEYKKNNRIANKQLWVNCVLAIATVGVFILSYLQYRSVKISADAAINAVKLSADQFEIENTPYLTVAEIKVTEFAVDKPIRVNYVYLNVGSQIVKLKSSKVGFSLEPEVFTNNAVEQINHINKLIPGESAISYVSDKIPYIANFTSKNSINKSSFEAVKRGELSFYMFGEAVYENVISHKQRKITFVFKLVTQSHIPEVYTVRLENSDI